MPAEVEPLSLKVVESAYTVSGIVIVILEGTKSAIALDTELYDTAGKKWVIDGNNNPIGRASDTAIQKKVKDRSLFMYSLQPIGHKTKPSAGEILTMATR